MWQYKRGRVFPPFRSGEVSEEWAPIVTEGGHIQVSALPVIAQVLGVGVEDLVSAPAKSGKRGPAPKTQQQLERVSQLPRARQRVVSEVLDSLLAAHQ